MLKEWADTVNNGIDKLGNVVDCFFKPADTVNKGIETFGKSAQTFMIIGGLVGAVIIIGLIFDRRAGIGTT